jgi:hypothetical protein
MHVVLSSRRLVERLSHFLGPWLAVSRKSESEYATTGRSWSVFGSSLDEILVPYPGGWVLEAERIADGRVGRVGIRASGGQYI